MQSLLEFCGMEKLTLLNNIEVAYIVLHDKNEKFNSRIKNVVVTVTKKTNAILLGGT